MWCTRTLAGSAPSAIARSRMCLGDREHDGGAVEDRAQVAPVPQAPRAGRVRLPGHVVAVHGDDQRHAEAGRGAADQPAVAAEVGVHEVRPQPRPARAVRRGRPAGEPQPQEARRPAGVGKAMTSSGRASADSTLVAPR